MTKELLQKCLDALDKSIIFANSQGIGGWQPTAMACHEAKAAIKQALAQQDQPSKTERQIRRMFCATYASNSSPYMDDGEAQDNSMHPCIDFLRDSPEQIQSKMVERAIAKHKEQHEQPTIKDSSTVGQDISSDEFLAVRLGRVAKLVGVPMPDMNHSKIAEVGTILGQIASKLEQPACNPHPKAPHGFLRNASHDNHAYTCECENWEPYEAGRQSGREEALAELEDAPTQPALSDADIEKFIDHEAGLPDLVGMKDLHPAYRRFARAIEAHYRGGVK